MYGVDEFLSTSWDPNTGPLEVGLKDRTSDTCWGTIFIYKPQKKFNTKKHSSRKFSLKKNTILCPVFFECRFLKVQTYNSPKGAISNRCLFPYRSLSAKAEPKISQYRETILKAFSSRTKYLPLSSSPAINPKVIILVAPKRSSISRSAAGHRA